MDSSLRERFARLGPIRDVVRVSSGSRATFAIQRPDKLPGVRTIDATFVLVRRGLTMLRAKRVMEAVLEQRRAVVEVPTVEDAALVVRELTAAGFMAWVISPAPPVDVAALRRRLRLTREQFALRYGLETETVRNWETGKREPDTTARSYLRVIAADPEHAERAYATRVVLTAEP